MSRTIITDSLARMIKEIGGRLDQLEQDSRIPAGTMLRWARAIDKDANINENSPNRPPEGYLFRSGEAISRTLFARLFSEFGTIHGAGDGSTTFNLPGGWKDLVIATSWKISNDDENWRPMCTKSADGFVHIRGMIQRTTTAYSLPVNLFTLPTGFRPERRTHIWAGHTDIGGNQAMLRLNIPPASIGGVTTAELEMGTNNKGVGSLLYLDGITFKAEDAPSPELTIIKT